MICNEKIDIK